MTQTNGEPTSTEILETVHEVLEAVNTFATNVDRRFERIETEIKDIRSVMVTKDELAKAIEPLATKKDLEDLKADIVILVRKEDTKVVAVVDVLKKRDVISGSDAAQILSMQPFPSA